MRRILETVATFLLIILLVIIGIFYFSKLTERKDSRNKFEEFYGEQEYEILFAGQSHVLNGIFPMELWKEYGFTSYNLAGHGNRLSMTYWVLKNALDYKTPKLIVLDCGMLGMEDKIASIEQLHISADHIPLSQNKIDMINDLVEEKERRSDFLFKFSTYHHRWNDLKEEDFVPRLTPEKGAESRVNVAVPSDIVEVEEDQILEEETLGIEYLVKIIEMCKEREIELLLTYLPFPDDSGWQIESNTMKLIAEEYEINALDFKTLLGEVDVNTDFYDQNSHMNPSGGKKITNYLGEYIAEHYEIQDYREDPDYESWHEDYEVYRQYKINLIREEKELKNLLMLLNDSDFSYGIYLSKVSVVEGKEVIKSLLENLEIDCTQLPEQDFFLFRDRKNGIEGRLHLFEELETDFGVFHLFYNEDGHLELTDGMEVRQLITFADIAVAIFENENKELISQRKFSLTEIDLEFESLEE